MHIAPTVAIASATTGVFAGLALLADRKGRWIVAAFLSLRRGGRRYRLGLDVGPLKTLPAVQQRRGGIQIRADQIALLLGIKPRRNAGRTNEVAEHHRDMPTLANGFRCGIKVDVAGVAVRRGIQGPERTAA
jgi:hypothetical protein